MSDVLSIEAIQSALIEIRGQQVLLDSDVAKTYGVETKRVNEAVRNNPNKFPDGYILKLTRGEFFSLRSKFSTANLTKSRYLPTAFPEKGLYMLATILKSPQAVQATLLIIEAFAKLRQITCHLQQIPDTQNPHIRKSLAQRSGDLLTELIADNLHPDESESVLELNLAVLKFKLTVKP